MNKLMGTALALGAALAASGTANADPLASPSMSATLSGNPNPLSVDAGPLGKVNVSGVVSGLAYVQDNVSPGDRTGFADLSNGQVIVQTTSGPIQFYLQGGGYSLPALGAAYVKSGSLTNATYGVLPVGYLKLAPTAEWSFQIGKLPTLIGAEYTFTFQNFNIERGLLWNQEPAISQGVQANYAKGPISASLSLNDGFYSHHYNWLSGSLAYTINSSNTIAFIGGGNFEHTSTSTFATPVVQNNGSVYNLIYTYSKGPLTISPYLQYSQTDKNVGLGITHSVNSVGGAVLAKYSFTPEVNVAARAEYISSSGSPTDGTPSVLYGPGSSAWSLTVTPTYQKGVFFARAELSYVGLDSTTAGFALGPHGTDKSQTRGVFETGVVF